jgi:hypothetical protein
MDFPHSSGIHREIFPIRRHFPPHTVSDKQLRSRPARHIDNRFEMNALYAATRARFFFIFFERGTMQTV